MNKSFLVLFFKKELLPFLCSLLFLTVFVIFDIKIIARYAFGDALAWADEICVVLFIWIIFIANGFLVEDHRQIAFDLIYRHAGPRTRRTLAMFRCLLVGGVFAAALPGSVDYIRFLWRERTPVLQWRLDFVYACFGLFMIGIIARRIALIVKLIRANWRDAI